MYCSYYLVYVNRLTTWFVVGCFRNEDGLVFERALEGKQDVLEFFVPKEHEERFLDIIDYLTEQGFVFSVEHKENRLQSAE